MTKKRSFDVARPNPRADGPSRAVASFPGAAKGAARQGVVVFAALMTAAVLAACSGARGQKEQDADDEDEVEGYDQVGFSAPSRGEATPSVSYADTAEANWQKGEEAYADEEFLAAQRYYAYVRSKFPYSTYAVLSEVRVGDCQFGRGRFIEAIDSFQNFVRTHPTHPKAAYAMFRIGEAYYEQIPGDWFILPPSHEKDQASVREAERTLRDYLQRFKEHEDAPRARTLLSDVERRLIAHERYAADFYRGLARDRAYVGRLEVIRTRYAEAGLDDALLLEIAEAWARIGEYDKTKSAVDELRTRFPDSNRRKKADEVLARVASSNPEGGTSKAASHDREAPRDDGPQGPTDAKAPQVPQAPEAP